MFKGALILVAGFTLGYVKAVQEQEDLRAAVMDVTTGAKDFLETLKREREATPEEQKVGAPTETEDNTGEDTTHG